MVYRTAEKLYGGVERFLEDRYTQEVISGNGSDNTFLGGMIISAPKDHIIKHTSPRDEFLDRVYEEILHECGPRGYSDSGRLKDALQLFYLFNRDITDHDGAIAISPDYRLIDIGRYIDDVSKARWKGSEALRMARKINPTANGRHIAGLDFSSRGEEFIGMPISESGKSIVTFVGGNFDQNYSRSFRE